jgi:uncharacterized protein YqfA (UPF0365 family)
MPRFLTATSFALAFTAIAYALCGATLGLFLCGLFAGGLLIALLDDPSHTILRRVLFTGCVIDAVAMVWLVSVFLSPITFLQWLQAYAVLVAVAGAVLGMRLTRLNQAMVAITWIAWFVAPVATAQAMLHSPMLAGAITRYHPLFALNRIFIEQGAWTSFDIAYRLLTPLGQDVAYTLPASVLPCVACHLFIMAAGAVSAWAVAWARRTATAPC